MKSVFSKFVTLLTLGSIVFWCSCAPTEQATTVTEEQPTAVEAKPAETRPRAAEEKPKAQPPVEPPPEEPVIVVAEIGDYRITKAELETRMINELRAYRADYGMIFEPVTPRTTVMKLLAEKAMIMEGRNQDLLKGDASYRRFYEGRLVGVLLQRSLRGKIKVTDAEVNAKHKQNPKWDRARARAMVEREKAGRMVEQFYNDLRERRNVKIMRGTFPRVAEIHNRLLYSPQKERRGHWIMNSQIKEELTPEEKSMVLATFDNGQITLADWFQSLNEMSPPSRPKDLGTVEGVERLLNRAMRTPIFLAEARSRGLDKDESFLTMVREREDRILLSKTRRAVFTGLERPTKEEAAEYFEKHKREFMSPDTLKIDQIWCRDFRIARKVKADLDEGKDFDFLKQQYSLKKQEKPRTTSATQEGVFFQELWPGEPNEIIGPVKGFYVEGVRRRTTWSVKWRLVKILEKQPGSIREFSSGVERDVADRIVLQQREALMANRRNELLEEYPYKIHADVLSKIDPFDIP
ncbi:MAG: hypothetical protein ACYTEQ_15740 [Planctomycetota bacterium]